MVKYGVIGDARTVLVSRKIHRAACLQRERAALDFVIPRCIRAKADVVGRDERESGLREILNFGHTFAHAFETATRYNRYLHGEAVGWGMIAAARLSAKLGMLGPDEAERIETWCAVSARFRHCRTRRPNASSKSCAPTKRRGREAALRLDPRIGEAETLEGCR